MQEKLRFGIVGCGVISQHRFDVASLQVQKLIEEQALGKLVLGNVIVPGGGHRHTTTAAHGAAPGNLMEGES